MEARNRQQPAYNFLQTLSPNTFLLIIPSRFPEPLISLIFLKSHPIFFFYTFLTFAADGFDEIFKILFAVIHRDFLARFDSFD